MNENPNCSQFNDDLDAKGIFDILTQKQNILGMIKMSQFKKPALAACVKEIENYIDDKNSSTINLDDHFTRQMIGRMIRTIMTKYGYNVDAQKEMPKNSNSKYFKSASTYYATIESKEILIIDDSMAIKAGDESHTNIHLVHTISFIDNDNYKTTKIVIDGSKYDLSIKNGFRSQGNIHLFLQQNMAYGMV